MITAVVALTAAVVGQPPAHGVGQTPTIVAVPTLGSWLRAHGPPNRSVEATDRVRDEGEPLMLYWMRVEAAPLSVGPALPGTLVANFDAERDREAGRLRDFTFLAVASPTQTRALVDALQDHGWIASEAVVARDGGRFRDLRLVLPDGRNGTVSLRLDATRRAMADGRPSPTLWMHVHR